MKRVILIAVLFLIYGIVRAENQNLKPEQSTPAAPGDKATSQTRKSLRALVSDNKAAKDPKERLKARMELLHYAPQNTTEVEDLLDVAEMEERGGDIQRDVLMSLKNLKDQTVGPVFYKRMKKKSGDPYVRAVAIGRLAGLKYKEAVPDMIKLVEDFDYERDKEKETSLVYMAAFFALGEMGDDRAIPAMLQKLGKMESNDAQVIARFGKKVAPQLLEIVRDSKDDNRRHEAGNALGMMKDKELIPDMWKILKDENDKARYAALNILFNTTDKTTLPTADEVMDYIVTSAKTNPAMLTYAVDVARRKQDVPYLIKVFQDSDMPHNLRTAAIMFLGDFKAQSAVPALEELLKDSDREIRMRVNSALMQITGKDYSGGTK